MTHKAMVKKLHQGGSNQHCERDVHVRRGSPEEATSLPIRASKNEQKFVQVNPVGKSILGKTNRNW